MSTSTSTLNSERKTLTVNCDSFGIESRDPSGILPSASLPIPNSIVAVENNTTRRDSDICSIAVVPNPFVGCFVPLIWVRMSTNHPWTFWSNRDSFSPWWLSNPFVTNSSVDFPFGVGHPNITGWSNTNILSPYKTRTWNCLPLVVSLILRDLSIFGYNPRISNWINRNTIGRWSFNFLPTVVSICVDVRELCSDPDYIWCSNTYVFHSPIFLFPGRNNSWRGCGFVAFFYSSSSDFIPGVVEVFWVLAHLFGRCGDGLVVFVELVSSPDFTKWWCVPFTVGSFRKSYQGVILIQEVFEGCWVISEMCSSFDDGLFVLSDLISTPNIAKWFFTKIIIVIILFSCSQLDRRKSLLGRDPNQCKNSGVFHVRNFVFYFWLIFDLIPLKNMNDKEVYDKEVCDEWLRGVW